MPRRLRRSLPLLAALLAPALLPASATAQRGDPATYRAWIDTTVAFRAGGLVDLGQLSGNVVVTTWERDEVRVRAWAERGRVESSFSPSRVWLRALGEERGAGRGRTGDSGFEVTVPARVRVRATSVSGDVSVSGTRGEVEASTTNGDIAITDAGGLTTVSTFSGDVEVTRLEGDLSVKTVGGDVAARDVRGDVTVGSTSGDVELHGVAGRTVTASSTNGDLLYEGAFDRDGRYAFRSHSGTVTLGLAERVAADMSLQTFSGTVNTDFPVTLGGGTRRTSSTHTLEFTLGGGGGRVRVETFSGDVVLRRAGAPRDRS